MVHREIVESSAYDFTASIVLTSNSEAAIAALALFVSARDKPPGLRHGIANRLYYFDHSSPDIVLEVTMRIGGGISQP